jgi:putative peptidoglycan lipid II flippase
VFASVRTFLVGGIVGKLLGIARELLSASVFGTGSIASAYRLSQAAFVIPLNGLLAESLTSGFTPTYSRIRAERASESRALFAGMHAILLVFSTAIALLVAVLSTPWVRLLAPGFDAHTVILTSQMVRIMVFAMPLYAFTSLCASAELAAGKAAMAAARASIQSIGLIVGTLLAWWLGKPAWIPAGFLMSYVWLAAWGIKSVIHEDLRLWPQAHEWAEGRASLARVWRAFRFVIWVPVVMQVHFVVERRVASVVDVNAVAALDYARFISETAVLLIAVPFGLAGLGSMARMSETQFRDAAIRSARILLYIGVPLSAGIALHSGWIVRLIFARGAFGAESIETTATILSGIALGLWAQLVGYAGVKFLSARGHNRAVVSIYVVALGCNIALNVLLERAIGVSVLGVATAAGSLVLGLSIMARLGLLATLWRDLLSLTFAAAGYIAVCELVPAYLSQQTWAPPTLFAGYWCMAAIAVRRHRAVLSDLWDLLRPPLPSRLT